MYEMYLMFLYNVLTCIVCKTGLLSSIKSDFYVNRDITLGGNHQNFIVTIMFYHSFIYNFI